jgi:hypothetical protein
MYVELSFINTNLDFHQFTMRTLFYNRSIQEEWYEL